MINKKGNIVLSIIILLFFAVILGVGLYLANKRLGFFNLGRKASTNGVVLAISPADIKTDQNVENTAAITINTQGNTVSAVEINISFDSSKITITSLVPGNFFPNLLVLSPLSISPSKAQLIIANQPSSQTRGVSGSGIIATLKFKAKDNSTINISESRVAVIGQAQNSLDTASGAQISIVPASLRTGVPDCQNLKTSANVNGLLVGTEYTFELSAGAGTNQAPITNVEMSVYGKNDCSDNLKPYAPASANGPGVYTIKWTPTKTGPFTAYGRVWNDGIAECRADCVDGPPRFLCQSAASCKITGNVVATAPTPSPSSSTSNSEPPEQKAPPIDR